MKEYYLQTASVILVRIGLFLAAASLVAVQFSNNSSLL